MVLLLFFSCSKDSGEKDKVLPLVVIFDPQHNQVFSPGENISIRGGVMDDKDLAEIHLHITNINTGALLLDAHFTPSGPNYTVTQSITAVAGVNYKIEIIAKDRSANQASAMVKVSCI